ncbi:amidohydrolase family protein [Aeromicrobium piscarium]|uniref:Amidohydrolase n=1 Tax=Aeromicrobium piscarium TaxID=2590901 RepID=A0A554RMF6_9ACTN|nr:amidohydrolase family protein [Aeromicrobium piscarium]TSD55279.1 amidohydrolase [Aeromicrobium piscarium]
MNATEPVGAGVAIDVHAHQAPKGLIEDVYSGRLQFPNVEVMREGDSHRVSFAGGAATRPIAPGLLDADRRAAWMSDNGIGYQVTGGWLDIFGYDLPADEGADWAEALTGALQSEADLEKQIVLGTVPLQDPEGAASALRRQRDAGSPGVMIASRAGELNLDDGVMIPFWEAADETNAVVLIHPGFGGASNRYHEFGLVNGLARLEDTTVTMARLLYAGVPARFPNARIVVSHGGAALPYVLGRLNRNHVMNADTTHDPMESFSHLYFDSVVFDPPTLRFLVDKVGADHVLLGSDYPFPIGDLTPRNVVDQAALSHDQRSQIFSATARSLFLGGEA